MSKHSPPLVRSMTNLEELLRPRRATNVGRTSRRTWYKTSDIITELEAKLSQPRAELEQLPKPSFNRGRLDVIPKGVDGREWLRKYLTAVEVKPAKHRGGRSIRHVCVCTGCQET